MPRQESNGSLDSILNSLKEFEKDFKRLAGQFQKIGDNSRLSGELTGRLDEARKRLLNVQKEISGIVGFVPSSQVSVQEACATGNEVGPPIIVRCKNWEDFKLQALCADNVSFLCREEEKSFQVDAVKGSKVFTYSGQFPTNTILLRSWLSKELEIEKSQVWEGILALG